MVSFIDRIVLVLMSALTTWAMTRKGGEELPPADNGQEQPTQQHEQQQEQPQQQDRKLFQPSNLMVPYAMAERPRLFLHMLAKSNNHHLVPPALRDTVNKWLEAYDRDLLAHMSRTYGLSVFPAMNFITQTIFHAVAADIADKYGMAMDDTLAQFEKQFEDGEKKDDGADGSAQGG